jgi:TolB protein
MLYNAYVNLAAAKDNAGSLEEALALVDKALLLRPDAAGLRTARELAAKYLDVQTYSGVDWAKTVVLLEELYAANPAYRDVEERLADAHIAYADSLATADDWCAAAEQYGAAVAVNPAPAVIAQRDRAQDQCDGNAVATVADDDKSPTAAPTTGSVAAAPTLEATPTDVAAVTPTVEPSPTPAAVAAPVARAAGGRILYAAADPIDGRTRIFGQAVGSGQGPSIVVEDGDQPSLRPDGQRLLYRNLRSDTLGISAIDPATGLTLRFTEFSEDVMPSWNPEGNRYAFASNRSGDRRWRVYVAWADVGGEASPMGFGETPAWHPAADLIAFRGCDETGNRCGLWTMSSSGSGSAPVTSVPADTQPNWSPDGRSMVFSSNGRDGNQEIYRVDTASGQVARLTDHPALDAAPAVSPDGAWVAFLSNRNGAWQIWGVPLGGGEAQVLADLPGGVGNWADQVLRWIN